MRASATGNKAWTSRCMYVDWLNARFCGHSAGTEHDGSGQVRAGGSAVLLDLICSSTSGLIAYS